MSDLLPIYSIIPQIKEALNSDSTLLLQASPGAGKSTVVPIELLNEPFLNGLKIIMLEPRRLAARAVAEQLANRIGEKVGETVGYIIRHENKTSDKTRLIVVTEGILSRLLVDDPFLEDYGLIIFDEFHERNLQGDFAFALARNLQTTLREDLRLLIMSATLPSGDILKALDSPKFLKSDSRTFPIIYYYKSILNRQLPIWEPMASTIKLAFESEPKGDLLCFLPGAFEIQKTAALVEKLIPNAVIFPLYGDLPIEKQRQVLEPRTDGIRKIILATSIAETSLTVQGVHTVVDSGLARLPYFDASSGFTRLVTAPVSLDSAVQRAGRAGRTGPGVCYRLWAEAHNEQLQPFKEPEILAADLASLAIELAAYGSFELPFITPPPPKAKAQAIRLLQLLEVLTDDNRLTDLGKKVRALGIHPRLGVMIIKGLEQKFGVLACAISAILEERDPLKQNDKPQTDFSLRVEAFFRAYKNNPFGSWATITKNFEAFCQRSGVQPKPESHYSPQEIGLLLAYAYPDRVGQRQEGKTPVFKLANGRRAKLHFNDDLADTPFIAVASLSGKSDESDIYLAAPVEIADLKPSAIWKPKTAWSFKDEKLIAQSELKWGDLVLQTKPLESVSQDMILEVLSSAVKTEKHRLIRLNEKAKQTIARINSLHHWIGEPWLYFDQSQLWEEPSNWLPFYASAIKKADDFENLPWDEIIKSLIPYELLADLDSFAPAQIEVPTGSLINLIYDNDGQPPILEVRLQELFGMLETPKVNRGKMGLLIRLLSPGFKPVQVTSDLTSFWTNTYSEVRKELRLRYPKHSWPENPFDAKPVKGAVKKSQS